MAIAKTRKNTATGAKGALRRVQVVREVGSAEILQQIVTFQADLGRWLSRQRFQPRTLLNQAAVAESAGGRSSLLKDAQRWYMIRGVVRASAKALRSL